MHTQNDCGRLNMVISLIRLIYNLWGKLKQNLNNSTPAHFTTRFMAYPWTRTLTGNFKCVVSLPLVTSHYLDHKFVMYSHKSLRWLAVLNCKRKSSLFFLSLPNSKVHQAFENSLQSKKREYGVLYIYKVSIGYADFLSIFLAHK